MMARSFVNHGLLFALLCGLLSPSGAQETGETVRIHGVADDDVYAAGGTVDVAAVIDGDAVLAGGRVTVSERVNGDVMAVGGTVSVLAEVADDVRIAAGDILLSGVVGDDAIAAGGNVTLAPAARVDGRAWLSGGRIDVAGTVSGELKAAGGRIVLSGRVHGDVDLSAPAISILDSAVIEGDLVYRSPQEAEIAPGARILGATRYEPIEQPLLPIVAAAAGAGALVLLGLIVTGAALFLAFPRFIADTVATIRSEPWMALGLGIAVFAATPVIIGVLFMTVIGWLPALVIGALYLILLLTGLLTGAFYVGDVSFGLRQRDTVSHGRRIVSFVVALIGILLLGLVPVLGTLLVFALLLLGVGALNRGMYRAYVAR